MTAPAPPSATIIAVGDELAVGQKLDTNSRWLAERLTELGYRVASHLTVPDDQPRLAGAIAEAAATGAVVIVTGGLGPTADDLTREALAEALGQPLEEDAEALAWITAFFRRRDREVTGAQRKQATRPAGATCLDNPNGTAPAIFVEPDAASGRGAIFCLPGPPREMRPLFTAEVAPRLVRASTHVVVARILRLCGIPEAAVADALADLMERSRNPLVGTTASSGIIDVRLRYEGAGGSANVALSESESTIRERLEDHIFASDDTTLAAAVLDLARARSEMIVVAESCTGGGLGSALTAVPGSSDVFAGGWITYSNGMKRSLLHVPADIVDGPPGAVSAETVSAMARGALENLGAVTVGGAHALAISGVAGPGGGSGDKPVGTVWIARASREPGTRKIELDTRRHLIAGDRDDVRARAVNAALTLLWRHLAGKPDAPLLWQVPSTNSEKNP